MGHRSFCPVQFAVMKTMIGLDEEVLVVVDVHGLRSRTGTRARGSGERSVSMIALAAATTPFTWRIGTCTASLRNVPKRSTPVQHGSRHAVHAIDLVARSLRNFVHRVLKLVHLRADFACHSFQFGGGGYKRRLDAFDQRLRRGYQAISGIDQLASALDDRMPACRDLIGLFVRRLHCLAHGQKASQAGRRSASAPRW